MMGILLIEMVIVVKVTILFNLVVIAISNKTKHTNLLHDYYFDLQNEITISRTYLNPSLE